MVQICLLRGSRDFWNAGVQGLGFLRVGNIMVQIHFLGLIENQGTIGFGAG